jgi:glycosyltransferase involved in cell wall biosynthesis
MISVVIPLLNEAETLPTLHERLTAVLARLEGHYEIIYVDDGSDDASLEILAGLYRADREHVRVIEFRRNFGKTSALVAGFSQSAGDVVITMDADLQDDPDEIPAMLAELERGNDVVTAWRVERHDRATKRLSSRLWNLLVKRASGTAYHDLNCGFKVYRREVINSIRLYSGMHRFIPILAAAQGFEVVEKPVKHHPRFAGRSKYGTGRVARV